MTDSHFGGKPILVVEDDATNRLVLARQLAAIGVGAEMACDGEEGLALWRVGGFPLVLTDLHMPRMDGYGLVRAIRREESPGRRTPVLAFSSDVRMGLPERVRDAGFDGFLAKPMQLDGLRAVLGRWLQAAAAEAAGWPGTQGGIHAAVAEGGATAVDFDVRALRELVGDEPGLVLEIVGYFDEVASGIRGELLQAGCTGEVSAAGMLAHRLKSSARSVGAVRLAEVCGRLEEDAEAGRGDLAGLRVVEVVDALDAALAAMRRWRAARTGEPNMARCAL